MACFCSGCGRAVEKSFRFCPSCGTEIVAAQPPNKSPSDSALERKVKFNLPSFQSFKRKKETERGAAFQFRKKAKMTKTEKQVTIQVGIMKPDKSTIKRGQTLPVKVLPSATAGDVQQAAMKKHEAFNKCFRKGQASHYRLVYKDGSEVKFIPATHPEESFTLARYKEESGFGYARIAFYLLEVGDIFDQLKETLETDDYEEQLGFEELWETDDSQLLNEVSWIQPSSSCNSGKHFE